MCVCHVHWNDYCYSIHYSVVLWYIIVLIFIIIIILTDITNDIDLFNDILMTVILSLFIEADSFYCVYYLFKPFNDIQWLIQYYLLCVCVYYCVVLWLNDCVTVLILSLLLTIESVLKISYYYYAVSNYLFREKWSNDYMSTMSDYYYYLF